MFSVTIQQLGADLTALETSFSKGHPEPVQFVVVGSVVAGGHGWGGQVSLHLAVVAVLFIVRINLMNLMMVRSIAQRRAWAIRLANGCKGARPALGAFIESLLLPLAGATAGSLLAWSLLRLVTLEAPIDLRWIDELSL